jgi:hypothetical protein
MKDIKLQTTMQNIPATNFHDLEYMKSIVPNFVSFENEDMVQNKTMIYNQKIDDFHKQDLSGSLLAD